jgi:general secretion pathway protein C
MFSNRKELKETLLSHLIIKGNQLKKGFNSHVVPNLLHPIIVFWFLFLICFKGFIGTLLAIILLPQKLTQIQQTSVNLPSKNIDLQQKKGLDYTSIQSRNLFDSEFTEAKINLEATNCEPRLTQAPFNLMAIIFGGTAESSTALIGSRTNPITSGFRLHEMLAEQYYIKNITKNRVYFARPGECEEYLEIVPPAPNERKRHNTKQSSGTDTYSEDGLERSGNDTKVTREWVDRALTIDFTKTLQDAKANPYVEGGKIKGFMLIRIKQDSVYEKLGLKDGDVIESINGTPLENAAQSIQLLNSMRGAQGLNFNVIRNGQQQEFNINVQ